jgi:hypothetical protein
MEILLKALLGKAFNNISEFIGQHQALHTKQQLPLLKLL